MTLHFFSGILALSSLAGYNISNINHKPYVTLYFLAYIHCFLIIKLIIIELVNISQMLTQIWSKVVWNISDWPFSMSPLFTTDIVQMKGKVPCNLALVALKELPEWCQKLLNRALHFYSIKKNQTFFQWAILNKYLKF